MPDNNYIKVLHKINGSKKILLVTHDRPDGDALSSTCAFIELLTGLNKKFFAYCYNSPPHQFNFLPHIEKVNSDKNKLNFPAYDLIIVLDCGSLKRTGLTEEIKNKNLSQFIVEFDHHPKTDNYADIEIRNPSASSTAEILYNFFKTSNIKINKNLATCLLTGILTDTGNFLYPVTTDQTVKIASEMLLYGARFPLILENTWRNKSLPAMKLWGQAINHLQINNKYNFAYSVLTHRDLSRNGITDEELEGVAGFLSNLYGVKALLLLREEEDGKIKGSLRASHSKIDISLLAQIFGGGGHAKASAFVADGKIEKTNNGWRII
jgi:phosphoesterase RecJ-like protein